MLNRAAFRRGEGARQRDLGRLAAVAAACVMLVFLAVGCGPVSGEPLEAAELEEARPLYLQNCARCHQADGTGYRDVTPALDGNPLVTLYDPQPAIDTVLEGRGGMPAFQGSLTASEIAQIVSYIRSAWGNDARAVAPSEVR